MWDNLDFPEIYLFLNVKLHKEILYLGISAWTYKYSKHVSMRTHTPPTPTYKLRNLLQYLKGKALDAIADLEHCDAAYPKALQRLEKKFGGERRKIGILTERLDKLD